LVLEEESELFIYHHRTENSENLFGFLEKADKQIFTELIKIS
jgi:Holliday junction resolvasome RuvABC DNA-binding subunit